ncbi:uncharacterized protein LOC128852072 [Cuculus canorus]|uniref:uncharacterized protein LOC128852072 n=1 Tax=Cuculus canorus TaxID=55661 RepID=UPI0023AA9A23|nr:uncharacterized protein LOC128852072 [Cuculus canorus]
MLQQEKHELAMALEKAEQSVAELTGAQNKLNAEVADLRAATANMSSVNEALASDKVQLNKLVLQLEQENEALSRKVDEVERRKVSDQEKLQLCERMNEELSAEKAHLEQLLKKAEEQEKGLQVELTALRKEKEEQLQVRPIPWCCWVGVCLLGSVKLWLLYSVGFLSRRHLVVVEGRRLCLLLVGKVLMTCRAVLQFSELSSASTDPLNPPVLSCSPLERLSFGVTGMFGQYAAEACVDEKGKILWLIFKLAQRPGIHRLANWTASLCKRSKECCDMRC